MLSTNVAARVESDARSAHSSYSWNIQYSFYPAMRFSYVSAHFYFFAALVNRPACSDWYRCGTKDKTCDDLV